eukprot:g1329.t1
MGAGKSTHAFIKDVMTEGYYPDMCGELYLGKSSIFTKRVRYQLHYFSLSRSILSCYSKNSKRLVARYEVEGSKVISVAPATPKKRWLKMLLVVNGSAWLILKALCERDQSTWVEALVRATETGEEQRNRESRWIKLGNIVPDDSSFECGEKVNFQMESKENKKKQDVSCSEDVSYVVWESKELQREALRWIPTSANFVAEKKECEKRQGNKIEAKEMSQNVLLECPVCLEDFSMSELFELSTCGHRACSKCWADHCTDNILTQSRANAAWEKLMERHGGDSEMGKINREAAKTTNYIMLHSRPCPRCMAPIMKNRGCNHMVCEKTKGGCGFEFCWVCMQAWSIHGQSWYNCAFFNQAETQRRLRQIYDHAKEMRPIDDSTRYRHHRNRYMLHLQAEKDAFEFRKWIEKIMEKNARINLDYLITSISLLQELRRIVQCSFVFSYFVSESGIHADMFRALRLWLISDIENLHRLIEVPVQLFKKFLSRDKKKFSSKFSKEKKGIFTFRNEKALEKHQKEIKSASNKAKYSVQKLLKVARELSNSGLRLMPIENFKRKDENRCLPAPKILDFNFVGFWKEVSSHDTLRIKADRGSAAHCIISSGEVNVPCAALLNYGISPMEIPSRLRWSFYILQERGVHSQAICCGISIRPLRESNYQKSKELCTWRAYDGTVFSFGKKVEQSIEELEKQEEISVKYPISMGSRIILDLDLNTDTLTVSNVIKDETLPFKKKEQIRAIIRDDFKKAAVQSLASGGDGKLYPAVAFYSTHRVLQLTRIMMSLSRKCTTFASSSLSNFPSSAIVDCDDGTGWIWETKENDEKEIAWIVIDLGTCKRLSKIEIEWCAVGDSDRKEVGEVEEKEMEEKNGDSVVKGIKDRGEDVPANLEQTQIGKDVIDGVEEFFQKNIETSNPTITKLEEDFLCFDVSCSKEMEKQLIQSSIFRPITKAGIVDGKQMIEAHDVIGRFVRISVQYQVWNKAKKQNKIWQLKHVDILGSPIEVIKCGKAPIMKEFVCVLCGTKNPVSLEECEVCAQPKVALSQFGTKLAALAKPRSRNEIRNSKNSKTNLVMAKGGWVTTRGHKGSDFGRNLFDCNPNSKWQDAFLLDKQSGKGNSNNQSTNGNQPPSLPTRSVPIKNLVSAPNHISVPQGAVPSSSSALAGAGKKRKVKKKKNKSENSSPPKKGEGEAEAEIELETLPTFFAPVLSWVAYRYCDGNQHKVLFYQLMSSRDHPHRDPKSWRLEASNDRCLWKVIDIVENHKFQSRRDFHTFSIRPNRQGFYSNFRLCITELAKPNIGIVQLGAFSLFASAVDFEHCPNVYCDAPKASSNHTVSEIRQDFPLFGDVIVSGEFQDDILNTTSKLRYSLLFGLGESSSDLRFEVKIPETSGKKVSVSLRWSASESEAFWGFGSQYSYFNQRGRVLRLINMEQGLFRGRQPESHFEELVVPGCSGDWWTSYIALPYFITSENRSLFFANKEAMIFDLGKSKTSVEATLHSSTNLKGTILAGSSPLELVELYTSIHSGRMEPLPDWTQKGAIVHLQGGVDAVNKTYNALIEHNVTVAAVWVEDWSGIRVNADGNTVQVNYNWQRDRNHYPDDFWNTLRSEVPILVYMNPFLMNVTTLENSKTLYEEAIENGFVVYVDDDSSQPWKPIMIDTEVVMIDVSNPFARIWFKDIIKRVLKDTSGMMIDYGEWLPFGPKHKVKLYNGENPTKFHNEFTEIWASLGKEVVYDVFDASNAKKKPLTFVRTGHSQSPAQVQLFWVGDQMTTWSAYDGLATVVKSLLSSGMSGFALSHSDSGGFAGFGGQKPANKPISISRSKELLLRWVELNTFTSILRTHQGSNPKGNVQVFSDADTLQHFARMTAIFAHLSTYRERLMKEALERGYPLVRPLLLHFPLDTETYNLDTQFMLGSELIIVPVLRPPRVSIDLKKSQSVNVYLPFGLWRRLWDEEPNSVIESLGGKQGHFKFDCYYGEPLVFFSLESKVGEELAEFVKTLPALGFASVAKLE